MPKKIIGTSIGTNQSGLYDPDCEVVYSDNAGDYFMMQPNQVFKGDSGNNLWLVKNGIVVKTLVRKRDLKDPIYEKQKKQRALVNKRTSAGRGYISLSLNNGEEYVINSKGMITNRRRFFEAGANAFTGQWILYGLSKRWNNSHPTAMWSEVRQSLGSFKNFYVWDMDNGSVRMWGGGGDRRIKSMYVSKELDQVARKIAGGK